jgi:hypothetical protein
MVTTIYLTISTDHFIDKPQTSNHRNNDDINGNPCTAYVDNSNPCTAYVDNAPKCGSVKPVNRNLS